MPGRPLRILVSADFTFAYGRGVHAGVAEAADPGWALIPLANALMTRALVRELVPDGIIVQAWPPHLDALRGLRVPVVNVSATSSPLRAPRVTVDDEAIGRAAAEHLLEKGVRLLAMIGGSPSQAGREAGVLAAAARAGIPARVFERDSAVDGKRRALPGGRAGEQALAAWLRRLPTPVGVVGNHDDTAALVVRTARAVGLAVPEDVAVVGVGDDPVACAGSPALSSVALPARRIGAEAARTLARLLAGQDTPRERRLPPLGVIARASSDAHAGADPRLEAALRLLRELAPRRVGIAAIAARAGVDRRWLERACRRSLGHGPAVELRRARLRLAQDLLGRTRLPLADIARRCGFASAPRLCAVFRAAIGSTPGRWRRSRD